MPELTDQLTAAGAHRKDKGKTHRRPMNMKRERFALELYAGVPPLRAMKIAGYTPRPENARRLANDPDIKRRIFEMVEQERGFAEVEAMRCRRERRLVAFANIAEYFEPVLDVDGIPTGRVRIKDFTKMPRDLAAAIAAIRPTKMGWEIKLHDKDAALRAIEDRVDPKPDKSEAGLSVNVTQNVGSTITHIERIVIDATHPDG